MSDEIRSFGAIMSPEDVRDYELVASAVNVEFPEEFEVEMRAVKDQGQVGSCVAHSLSEAIEYHNYHQNNRDDIFSTAYIYGNRKGSSWKGSGMIIRDALENVRLYGDVTTQWAPGNYEVPYAQDYFNKINSREMRDIAYPNRISSYYRVRTEAEIKTALMQNGPVIFAVYWYSDAKVDANGILRTSYNSRFNCGGHCTIIYGWDKNGWKLQNSWSTDWGVNGRCIIPYEYPIAEAWGVVDEIVDAPQLKKPFGKNKFTRKFAVIINKIINIFCRRNNK